MRPVVAAGGIVLHGLGPATQVLVVHRPVHNDWSLPKGHVDPDESLTDAALREVAEETGIAARIVRSAGTTEHLIQREDGERTKQVHWFVMRPLDATDLSARSPDAEVDRAAWWPIATALDRLTYIGERTLLGDVLALR